MGRKFEKYLGPVLLFILAQFQSSAQTIDSFTLESDSLIVRQVMTSDCLTNNWLELGDDAFWHGDTACFIELIYFLNIHVEHEFEIQLHSDCRASANYNLDYTQQYAESFINLLISLGLNNKQVVPKGYGESQLKNDCWCEKPSDPGYTNCTEEQHAENRRVVLKVIE